MILIRHNTHLKMKEIDYNYYFTINLQFIMRHFSIVILGQTHSRIVITNASCKYLTPEKILPDFGAKHTHTHINIYYHEHSI